MTTLDQFITKYLGKQVEYHSYSANAKYQCVDLVNQYIVDVWGLKAIIGTHAKDFPENLKPGMEYVVNTKDYLPEPGEIVVWNDKVGGGFGHIAIVIKKGLQTVFYSLDQNWSKPLFVTQEKHSYGNVRGFIRKKGTMANELEACMADRKKFWAERDAALAKVKELEQKIKIVEAEKSELQVKLTACQNAPTPPTDTGEWVANGKSVTVTEGNTTTTVNYALK